MVLCPFLSTADEHVECFSDCTFNSTSKSFNECPFKSLEKDSSLRRKRSSRYSSKEYGSRDLGYYDELEFDELDII